MSGYLATEPIKEELKQKVKAFLQAMRDQQFDLVYHQLITPESAWLLSAVLWPLMAYKDGKVDEFIELSKVDELAMAVHLDTGDTRSGFFAGIEGGLANIGWYEFSDTDCLAFVDGTTAAFIASTPKTPLIVPFTQDRDGTYKVDFAAMALFSMEIKASTLYQFGVRALELGHRQFAVAMFELAASLSIPYSTLRRLIWNHPIVGQYITEPRKKELEEEAKYAFFGRDQVLQSFAVEDRFEESQINIGRFLASTFRGYSQIPETQISPEELEQLYALKDDRLRNAIASTLVGVDPVYAQREANKPHTGAEISDIELAVEYEGQMYQLCMPFKSGVEIRDDKVPVNIAYQIIRPFVYLPKCIVVFITAKPCSQYLHNYIKQAIATQGWAIGVIEHEALAKLLKINGLLTGKKEQ
jgi:hypothetical protein